MFQILFVQISFNNKNLNQNLISVHEDVLVKKASYRLVLLLQAFNLIIEYSVLLLH